MEKVYLFKDDFGQYAGYTESKDIKNDILKQRKHYECIKVSKEAAEHEHYIYEDYELYYCYDGIVTNLSEEDFFVNAFEQYKIDVFSIFVDMFEQLVDVFKLTPEEIQTFGKFFELIEEYKSAYEQGVLEEYEYDGGELYRYGVIYRHFIQNVLGIKMCKRKKMYKKGRK